jgi:hypothetical protein
MLSNAFLSPGVNSRSELVPSPRANARNGAPRRWLTDYLTLEDSEISQNNILFVLSSIFSISLEKMLSINVAVCCVILVGLNINGKNEDVNICSRNLLV